MEISPSIDFEEGAVSSLGNVEYPLVKRGASGTSGTGGGAVTTGRSPEKSPSGACREILSLLFVIIWVGSAGCSTLMVLLALLRASRDHGFRDFFLPVGGAIALWKF